MSYKIVFQGGGAKLFPLISAVEAVQNQIDDDDSFSVSTVAGASAGAIASMILAAGINCKELREHFKTDAGRNAVLSAFPSPTRISVLRCLMFGKTLFDRSRLEELLYKILEIGGHSEKKSIITLQSKLIVAITDLRKSKVHFTEISQSSVENIVKNVADSCSIPFVFKNHNSRYNWEFVDGGLFENFPVSSLASSVDDTRKILGFSFSEETVDQQEKNPTLLSYLKVLVSTAIDANISASLRLLGDENVFTIKTEISTLDFRNGLEQFVNFDNRLESVKQNISAWIERVIKREKQIDASIEFSDSAIVPTDFSTFSQFAAKLFHMRKSEPLIIIESLSYFQINSIYSDAAPNKSRFEFLYRKYVIEVPEDGLECFVVWTSHESTIDVEKYSDFIVLDSRGNRIDFTILPLSGSEFPADYVALAIFFDRRIKKSESSEVAVIMKQFLPDILAPLTTEGLAHLIVGTPPGTQTEKLLLLVGMPQEYAHLYHISVLDDCRKAAGEALKAVPAQAIENTEMVSEVRSGATQVTGYEADGPIASGAALALRLEKISAIEAG